VQGDISAGKMIFGVEGIDPDRRARLVRLLDIDLYQRMNTMSDGQRRRVQICMGLLKPYDVGGVLPQLLQLCDPEIECFRVPPRICSRLCTY
jgi:hypothetical protein